MIDIKFIKRRYKFILVVVVLLSTSIVSAAYSQALTITGDGHIRVDADVRITGLKATNQNGGIETYNGKYGKEAVYLYTSLPSTNSTVIYDVTIRNKADHAYVISNESTTYSNGENIVCNIEHGTTGKVLPKKVDTKVTVTCKYKDGISVVPENPTQITTITFKFERPTAEMVTYDHTNSQSKCSDVQCALDDLYEKLK